MYKTTILTRRFVDTFQTVHTEIDIAGVSTRLRLSNFVIPYRLWAAPPLFQALDSDWNG